MKGGTQPPCSDGWFCYSPSRRRLRLVLSKARQERRAVIPPKDPKSQAEDGMPQERQFFAVFSRGSSSFPLTTVQADANISRLFALS